MTPVPGFSIGDRQFPLRHLTPEEMQAFMPSASLVLAQDAMRLKNPTFVAPIEPKELAEVVAVMVDGSVSEDWIANNASCAELQNLIRIQVQYDGVLEKVTAALKFMAEMIEHGPQA